MLDVAPSEFLIVAVVALVVIGPKDLPKAMRVLGYWVGRARGVARQFRSGFDNMVRESELAEMEKKWAEENARIMSEHRAEPAALPSPADDGDAAPVSVEKPVILPAPDYVAEDDAPSPDGVAPTPPAVAASYAEAAAPAPKAAS